MSDLDRLLSESLKSVGESYRPADVAGARERFLKRRRRRLTIFIASGSVATAAAVVLAFFLMSSPEKRDAVELPVTQRLSVDGLVTVSGTPRSVAAGGGVVWVSDTRGLSRLDPETGGVLDHVELGSPAGDIVQSSGTLWVAEPELGVVHALDPRSGLGRGPDVEVPEGAGADMDLAVGLERLWVAGAGGSVFEFDRTTGDLLGEHPFDSFVPTEVAAGEGQVWALDGPGGRAVRIELAPGAPTLDSGEVRVPPSNAGNDIALGLGSIWVGSGAGEELHVFDLASGARRRVQLAGTAIDISLGPTEAWVLASQAERSRLFRFSPDGFRVGQPLPIDGGGAGISAGEGAVWVTLPDEDVVARVLTTEQKEAEERDFTANEIPADALLFAYVRDEALIGMYGDGRERILAEQGGGWNPAFSPNTRTLLYTARNEAGVTELNAIDVTSPEISPRFVDEGVAPSFGLSGQRAVWLRPFDDPEFSSGEIVFGRPSRGGARVVLDIDFPDDAIANRVHWDAGEQAIYIVGAGSVPRLYRVELPKPLRSSSVTATLVEPEEEEALYLTPTSRAADQVDVIKLCCPGTINQAIESAEIGRISFASGAPSYEPIVSLNDIVGDAGGLKLTPAGSLDATIDDEGRISWTMGTEAAWLVRYLNSVWLVDASGDIISLGRLADVGIGSAPGLISDR